VAIIIANTEATKKEKRKAKALQPVAAIGEYCSNKRCPKGTSCRKVSFQLINLDTSNSF